MAPVAPTAPGLTYATFWQRFGALFIDGLVFAPLWFVTMAFVMDDVFREFQTAIETNTEPDLQLLFGSFGTMLWLAIAGGVLQYAYQAVMVARWNATLGKMAVGLRVRRPDGSPATWREALLRPLLPTFGGVANLVPGVGLIALLDYFWMLWDERKQTVHDKIASTIVVTKESPTVAG